LSDLTTVGFGDDAQHRHHLEGCRGDSTADVADEGGLTGDETKDVGGSTRGSTQPIIIVFIDGMIFRSAEKRLPSEGLVALGQGVNYSHEVVCF
jgi:hypothetical protein